MILAKLLPRVGEKEKASQTGRPCTEAREPPTGQTADGWAIICELDALASTVASEDVIDLLARMLVADVQQHERDTRDTGDSPSGSHRSA